MADGGRRVRVGQALRDVWPRLVLSLVLVAGLEGIRGLWGATWQAAGATGRWGLVIVLLVAAEWAGEGKGRRLLIVGSLLILATGAYLLTRNTSVAWMAWTALLVWVGAVARATHERGHGGRALTLAIVCVAGGMAPVLLDQIESRFSDEEFFVALEAGLLIAWTGLFAGAQYALASLASRDPARPRKPTRWHSLALPVYLSAIGCLAVGLAAISAYRHSFFPMTAPSYPGITRSTPFICGRVEPDPESPGGTEIFVRLVERVKAGQPLQTPDYGFLALATHDRQWAEGFREAVLRDARDGKFTGPAHSVKYGQYLAAQRIWYLQSVVQAFPELFTAAEMETLWSWTAAVNERALTVEWVDWAYGFALSSWPAGPYENQDNGLGLLAVLEQREGQLGALSAENRGYLEVNQRGWAEAFRNTDDAYIYQPEWISNALFQITYYGQEEPLAPVYASNQRLSFEWLLLQALPDGMSLDYNHPDAPLLAGTAYLGATLLQDPRYVWWSARLLDWAESAGIALPGQPGVQQAATVYGISPVVGSCLIYGDSGLPTQKGPLAPDKIVFRDGWTSDSQYLLLNLRFSGWHRYRATNAVVTVHQAGPLAVEPALGEQLGWLPEGRALLRDKRVSRESLNGLLVPRRGLSAVLLELTGFGSPWAQDPPYYARVDRFETLPGLDVSVTSVEDWAGWSHTRSIYFYHDGPILIVDEAGSDPGVNGSAAIRWQLVGDGRVEDRSLWLRQWTASARVAWGQEAWPGITLETLPDSQYDDLLVQATYRPAADEGDLGLATMWLLGDWAESQHEATVVRDPSSANAVGQYVSIAGQAGRIELLHHAGGERLEANGLATDGQALSVRWAQDGGTATICAVAGSYAEVRLADRPQEISLLDGGEPGDGSWTWQDGQLVVRPAGGTLCLRLS